tara:strand:+ start:727 stop:1065 length:339 start_codon:yes stop_codon:yes gene_type:complete
MAVPRVNIQIEAGTDFEATYNVTQSDGSPLDLTNHSISAKMRKHHSSSGHVAFGATFGGDPTNGEITISLTDAQTGVTTEGRYNYDVIITNDINGKKEKVISGQALLNPTIS